MIDLHCHILPGIDDGPEEISQAIEMAKIAVKDGISKIVATPHIRDDSLSMKEIEKGVDQLNLELQEQNIPLEIYRGGEVVTHIDPSLFKKFSINGSNYVLIEFPFDYFPASAGELLFQIRNRGLIPLIAHPERNQAIQKNPNLLLDLLDSNILIQMNGGSLIGDFGRNEKHCARFLLKKGIVTVLSSDGHDLRYRRPVLSAALKAASKLIGGEQARMLVNNNPQAILEGRLINGKSLL